MDRQQRIGFILGYADSPRHRRPLADADVVLAGGGSECGESVTLYFKVDEDHRITRAAFAADGTTIGRAAASITTERIVGKTLAEVLAMSHDLILDALGRDIVGDRYRAVTVALDTAKAAARNYLAIQVARQGL